MILTAPVPVIGINSACVTVTCIYQFFIGIIIRFSKKISVGVVCIESLVIAAVIENGFSILTACDFTDYVAR